MKDKKDKKDRKEAKRETVHVSIGRILLFSVVFACPWRLGG
jgi:hypothetical protein